MTDRHLLLYNYRYEMDIIFSKSSSLNTYIIILNPRLKPLYKNIFYRPYFKNMLFHTIFEKHYK